MNIIQIKYCSNRKQKQKSIFHSIYPFVLRKQARMNVEIFNILLYLFFFPRCPAQSVIKISQHGFKFWILQPMFFYHASSWLLLLYSAPSKKWHCFSREPFPKLKGGKPFTIPWEAVNAHHPIVGEPIARLPHTQ